MCLLRTGWKSIGGGGAWRPRPSRQPGTFEPNRHSCALLCRKEYAKFTALRALKCCNGNQVFECFKNKLHSNIPYTISLPRNPIRFLVQLPQIRRVHRHRLRAREPSGLPFTEVLGLLLDLTEPWLSIKRLYSSYAWHECSLLVGGFSSTLAFVFAGAAMDANGCVQNKRE